MRLIDFVHRYGQSRDVSCDYVKQLVHCVHAVDSTLKRSVQVNELTADLLNEFLHKQKGLGLKPNTRKNRRRMLLTLWRNASANGLVAPINCVPIAPVRQVDTIVEAWTSDQVRQLLELAENLPGNMPKLELPKALYWGSWIRSAWDSGLRGCDLRRMERKHIGCEGSVSLVQVKVGKRQRIKLRASTVACIDRSLCACPRDLVWPVWTSIPQWRKAAKKLVALAGLPGSIGLLRHSSGTDVELAAPGRGHEHLGNTRAVFLAHYFDDRLAAFDRPMPREL